MKITIKKIRTNQILLLRLLHQHKPLLLRLHTQGQPIDPITVADEVQTGDGRPGIDPANVIAYLTDLSVTAHSPRYAQIVAYHARLRRLLHLAVQLTDAVHRFDDTAIAQALDGLAKETAT